MKIKYVPMYYSSSGDKALYSAHTFSTMDVNSSTPVPIGYDRLVQQMDYRMVDPHK